VTNPAGTTRRARLDAGDRRQQILEAAQALFAERPYEEVSTADIAERAGTSRPNLHYHFRTKRVLYLAIVRQFALIPYEASAFRLDGPLPQRVSHLFGRWLDAVERNRTTYMAMLRASVLQDPEVSAVLRESMEAWEERLLRIIGADTGDAVNHAMVRAFQSMVSTATTSWLETGIPTKAQVQALLTNGLLALQQTIS
jgi:AcrR family transcriptional regulator